ncbi:MAG: single-stranded DNA-binding protein, partial [Desulfosporosinus sp.]
MNLNKAQLIGRITSDPELRALPSGISVAKFGLATNHIYKTKDGEKKETAQFH